MKNHKINAKFSCGIFDAIINMSFLTNLAALAVLLIGLISPFKSEIIKNIGVFALSGSVTNWIAVHMLFEKIPFLYGSGIVELRFEAFKQGIKNLVMEQFFNQENARKLLSNTTDLVIDKIEESINYDKLYQTIVVAIMESPASGFINMMGGKEALTPLKEPILEKLKQYIANLQKSIIIQEQDVIVFTDEAEKVISDKINTLTAKMVKQIVQAMIKKHLGWLVLWGAVFGGLIGVFSSII